MKERYEQLLYMFMQFWLKKNYTQSEKKNYYRIYLSKHLTTNIPYCTLRCLTYSNENCFQKIGMYITAFGELPFVIFFSITTETETQRDTVAEALTFVRNDNKSPTHQSL